MTFLTKYLVIALLIASPAHASFFDVSEIVKEGAEEVVDIEYWNARGELKGVIHETAGEVKKEVGEQAKKSGKPRERQRSLTR